MTSWPRAVVRDMLVAGAVLAGSLLAAASTWALASDVGAVIGFLKMSLATYAVLLLPLLWFARRRFSPTGGRDDAVLLLRCSYAPLAVAIVVGLGAAPVPPQIAAWFALVLLIAPAGVRIASGFALRHLGMERHLWRRVAVFGATEQSLQIFSLLAEQSDVELVGLYDDRLLDFRRTDTGIDVTGTLSDLRARLAAGDVDDVIICLAPCAQDRIEKLRRQLGDFPVHTHLPVNFALEEWREKSKGFRVARFGQVVVANVQRPPLLEWNCIVKWAEDRIGGTLLLLLAAPFMALIAVAIKIDSAGPIFFRQRRNGVGGREFVIWKFRTMHVADDGPVVHQARKNDPRVTRVGRILRRTSLDELPQLINVVLGDMSIVGPRPHAAAHNELYSKSINDYSRRALLKPGITGWAQIHGYRGEVREPGSMEKRVELDLWYIRNWSLWLDIRIILATPIYGFVHSNAY